MKIIEKNLHQGYVKLVPDSPDDLWHLSNVIYAGDEVYAYSSRAIKSDTDVSRPKSGERVSVFMGVTVESIVWDKFLARLRVHGVICHAPDIIPKGAYHTINVVLNQPVTIVKKEWPKHLLDRLQKASEAEKPLIIIAIDDEGYAIAETKQYGVEVRVEERVKLPGKKEAEKRSGAMNEYFKRALSSLAALWISHRNAIVVVGVGFIKNEFANYVTAQARDVAASIADVKSVNNGGVSGIYEALRSGILLKTTHQLRILEETTVIEEVMKRLGRGDATVSYGIKSIETAVLVGAVEKLVVADSLLRDAEVDQRLKLEKMMQHVEQCNGAVTVVSTEHEAGAKLLALGGIAALLRFPVYSSD
ncbi:MAG: mRNA surveillance protein pelota [Candidatus Bathyarchaeota archaeon]|nr:mRNA surveillance protein pelota [Candidatus Bathyarchaeota archaeon]